MRAMLGRATAFDVICAGDAASTVHAAPIAGPTRTSTVDVVQDLARRGLRVGLATVFEDDPSVAKDLSWLASRGIDVGGVKIAPRRTGMVVVDAAGDTTSVLADRNGEVGVEVPAAWSAAALLLSGVSPVTAVAAALCRAARRARRTGTTVILDLSPSLRLWAGREPRTVATLLREVDVVRFRLTDLAVMGTDLAAMREVARPGAVFVVDEGPVLVATGRFGEVRVSRSPRRAPGADVRSVGSLCAGLSRPKRERESEAAMWHRMLSDD